MSFHYGPKIITDDLVLYLDAANTKSYVSGSTIWNDLSKNQNLGTLTNGPTYNNSNGGSIVFDGVDDYVSLTNTILLNTGVPKTFSIWFKSLSSTGNRTLISDMGYSGNRGWALYCNLTTGQFLFGGSQNGSTLIYRTTTNGSVNINNWYNIVVTYNPSIPTALFYLNGVLLLDDGDVIYNTYRNSTIFTQIGAYGGASPNALWNGHISNVTQYNKSLTQTEILQNYNATKGRFGL